MNIKTLIKHRVNTIADLRGTPTTYGAELDLRTKDNYVILHHDAFKDGDNLNDYLSAYQHQTLILNTKVDGLEEYLFDLLKKKGIDDFFLLDTTVPSMVKWTNKGFSKIAVRFSEYEPLSFVQKFEGKADWVWVDCFTQNILTPDAYTYLKKHFKICIVSPELQGHPTSWITDFKNDFNGFDLDAVCTKQPDLWK